VQGVERESRPLIGRIASHRAASHRAAPRDTRAAAPHVWRSKICRVDETRIFSQRSKLHVMRDGVSRNELLIPDHAEMH
jgi:hypothetical protein